MDERPSARISKPDTHLRLLHKINELGVTSGVSHDLNVSQLCQNHRCLNRTLQYHGSEAVTAEMLKTG